MSDNTINLTELAKEVAEKAEMPATAATTCLKILFDAITDHVSKGETVAIYGFGTFAKHERGERLGRNPQTGASMTIKARSVPTFKASKRLKDAVNGVASA